MKKTGIAMIVILVAMVGLSVDSAPFRLDTVTISTSPAVDSLSISWDVSWIGGNVNSLFPSFVVIADNGAFVTRKTGAGQFTYPLSGDVRHELTYTTYIGGVAQSEVYTATFYMKRCGIAFDANGGNVGESNRYVTLGEAIGTLPTPMRTGYSFVGWWTDANGGTQITASTTVSDNVTYYAHWTVNQYTVTFDANGGTVTPTSTMVTYDAQYGSLPIPTRTQTQTGYSYRFDGWYTDASGGTLVTADATVAITAAQTLYAHWTESIETYSVTYAPGVDGLGTQQSDTKTYNVALPLKGAIFTRTGYTQTGWATTEGGAKVYDLEASYTTNAAITLYPAWTPKSYTVTFDANGGTGGRSGKQDYGTTIVAPAVAREWCTFAGWSPSVAATVPASNVTYTARWRRWGDSISASELDGKTMRRLYPDDYAHMTTVVLEEGITELPDGFFDGCADVESVTWPATFAEFGRDVLPPKAGAELAYDASGFMIYNGWILDYRNRSASAVTIPNGIDGIGRGAFAEMYDLETVAMPESLRCIARCAFEGCTYIQELRFASGLRYVGPAAFRDCSSLLGASFADGLEHVGTNAFKDCWQMRSVRLPHTVTNIGDRAFSGCGAIRGVTVPTHVKTMQNLFPASYSQIETAEVAGGETTVMSDMFAGCVSLRGGATQTDMSMIPNTVTNIGARAFQGCTSLTAFVVPDSVTELGARVFQGCTALWNVTLSRSLSAIPDYAFYGCSMLESMVVPAGVTYLGNRFFSGRTSPTSGSNALYYLCANAPACHSSAYAAIAGNMTTYVLQDSRGWDGRQGSRVLPQSWNGYPVTYWTPNRFDVTFDANGGRFGSAGGSTWSEPQITDTTYALPSTEPVRPGWAFEGWWTEQTGGAEVRYTTRVTATRTHTLYAHWRSLGNSMTVTFNSNGGTAVVPGAQSYVPGQTFGQFPVPTRRGYTFQGWWTKSVGGIRMTEATEVPAANMELFAHWSPVTYYVRFNANGGVGSPVYQLFTFDVQQALATHTFTRAGFAFTGWATASGGQVRYPENKAVVNLAEVQDEVVELYAIWSGVGYSVRFDSNGGTGVMDNQTIAVGETQNLWPCAFIRGGYTFAGWAVSSDDAANGRVAYLDGAAVRNLATSNGAVVPLYAVWVSSSQIVRVSFDANGGSVSPGYWNCEVGTAVASFPTPTRPGFTFAGWWTMPSGGIRVSSIASVTASQTLYAHWMSNGGTVPGEDSGGGSTAHRSVFAQPSLPWTAKKAKVLDGAIYDAEGKVAGVIQLKVAKPNAKKHNAKVSGSVTLLDGKKRTLKAAAVNVPADAPIAANLAVKGLGMLSLAIGDDGFTGSVGGYSIAAAKVGGKWTRTDAKVTVTTSANLPQGTVESLLPDGEPVRAKGGKWAFDKAAAITYKKGVLGGDSDPKKPNRSAMKLTYTPKTGLFKGSFKVYAVQGGKLKKYTVKVTGVVVDGEGTGVGKLAKPSVTWRVRVSG